MAEALKFDQNSIRVGGAVTDDVAQVVEPLLVDPSTDRLLIEVITADESEVTDSVAKRDQNHRPVLLGVTDDGDIREIACDENGYILVDIEEE